MQESRRSRLAQGALGWELLHDITEPGRYVEQITAQTRTAPLKRLRAHGEAARAEVLARARAQLAAGMSPEATELANRLARDIGKLEPEDLSFLSAEVTRRLR